jgi:hypothetical protein
MGEASQPVTVKVDPTIDMKTPPKIQVDTMPTGRYFAYAAELLKVNPPHNHRSADDCTIEEDRYRTRQKF